MLRSAITETLTADGPGLPARLDALIDAEVPPERAAAVRAFAHAYVRRLSADAHAGRDAAQLLHELRGAFELMAGRGAAPVAVRAFNPTVEEHGYETAGTVLETNTDDLAFLVDSVSAELEARGLAIDRLLHPIVGAERDADGRLTAVLPVADAPRRESVMHFEVDRRLGEPGLRALETAVHDVLTDVREAVAGFGALSARVDRMVEMARTGVFRHGAEATDEAVAFLRWLRDGNFVFLGFREYAVEGDRLRLVPGSGLGLLSGDAGSALRESRKLADLPEHVRAALSGDEPLRIAKSNRTSRVYRRTRMDCVGVVSVDDQGEVVGAARLLGLFTSRAYAAPVAQTPVLERKLRELLAAEELVEGSHDHKSAVALFGSFPRDELFAAPVADLRRAVVTLLGLASWRVRLLAREHPDGRGASLIVALPKERASPALVEALRRLVAERFAAASVEATLVLGEHNQARVHLAVHAPNGLPDVAIDELRRDVARAARTWDDRLRVAVGRELADRWAPRFGDAYKAAVDPDRAAVDVACLERLEREDEPFVVGLRDGGARTRVTLYRRGTRIDLSSVVPVLEALGLRVVEELPWTLRGGDGEDIAVHDFGVVGPGDRPLDLAECAQRVAECFTAVWRGQADADSLNGLVITAGLDWRQVAILRAYRSYRQRVGSRFGPAYERDALLEHPRIAALLVRAFELRFDPARERDEGAEEAVRAEILEALDGVESLDQDRILRDQLTLVEATLRTNAYVPERRALALKLRSADVPGTPQPAPLLETFVHSPRMEGVHLRGGLVARGGIRHSDRADFRTEVLGLMRAQMTKNAVIVPAGAKGGFYVKRRPVPPAEVEHHYRVYIRALLELTDNLVDGATVRPDGVRALDGDDSYLVVAADKGTAAFSDVANEIALERGYWLGDAFASGGSTGYDHKALGITARGAWEAVKRHFRELGHDIAREPFTAVGIGDMSGDVFGNGMLLSDRIRLVAAYDHRHVFVDPEPDPEAGFAERRRLFELRGSSWDDYDRERISEGGGVWPRTAKAIPVSEQMRAALGIDAERLTPDELIQAVLRAPVDLLFNGGIGTVVKASDEPDAAARDRASDAIRVDARDLRCRVVAEGGNLGFTQRARIEFARGGGRIQTDFIDNSAGVDCSDHEVNLKVLLDLAVRRGALTGADRDALLRDVTEEVVAHVLADSYRQARTVSLEAETSAPRMSVYEELIARLEAEGALHRVAEGLPSEEELAERRRTGEGMERPEVAVVLAHAKQRLTDALLDSDVPDDPSLEADLRTYFPRVVVERFGDLLAEHPLRRELVSTLVANDLVDSLGVAFAFRLEAELGVELADVVRAYRAARGVTGAAELWHGIEMAAPGLAREAELELLLGVDALVDGVTRWYLAHPPGRDLAGAIEAGRGGFRRLEALVERHGGSDGELLERLLAAGVPEGLARRHALLPGLVHAPQVVVVAHATGRSIDEAGLAFALLDERLRIVWLLEVLERLPAARRPQRWAMQALRDDAVAAWGALAECALRRAGDGATVQDAVEDFLDAREARLRRLLELERALGGDEAGGVESALLAVRELRALAE